ncbi:MAG: hypothetical protein ACPGSC_05220 [Granulosicoccaceae bacterium]
MNVHLIKSIKTQRGTAITDFLVAMLVFSPLFLLYPVIGKISDVEHSAQQSARYAAWERTASSATEKSNAVINHEMHARVVNQQTFIESNSADKAEDLSDKNDRMLWGVMTPTGGGTRQELVSFEKVGMKGTSGTSRDLGKASDLLVITHGMSDLDRNGFHKAEIDIAINEIALLEHKGKNNCNTGEHETYLTCVNRHNSILVDDWSASSPAQAINRVQERMPVMIEAWKPIAHAIGGVENLFDKADTLIGFNPLKDIKAIDDAPGYVAPDVVPQSKLGSYEAEGIKESLD